MLKFQFDRALVSREEKRSQNFDVSNNTVTITTTRTSNCVCGNYAGMGTNVMGWKQVNVAGLPRDRKFVRDSCGNAAAVFDFMVHLHQQVNPPSYSFKCRNSGMAMQIRASVQLSLAIFMKKIDNFAGTGVDGCKIDVPVYVSSAQFCTTTNDRGRPCNVRSGLLTPSRSSKLPALSRAIYYSDIFLPSDATLVP